jgi:hypothetical protein
MSERAPDITVEADGRTRTRTPRRINNRDFFGSELEGYATPTQP